MTFFEFVIEFANAHPVIFGIICSVAFVWGVQVFLLPFKVNSWLKKNSGLEDAVRRVENETKINRNALEKNQDVMALLIETIRGKNNKGKSG